MTNILLLKKYEKKFESEINKFGYSFHNIYT